MRQIWLREFGRDAENVIRDGLSLNGVLFTRFLVMPEWRQPEEWTQMGLFDCKLAGQKLKLRGQTIFPYGEFISMYLE